MAAGMAIGTLILYSPSFHYEFLNFDDDVYVTKNPHVSGGLSVANARWAFELPGPGDVLHAANWHPLTWLSLQLDASLWGASAGAFHATNVVLHALASVLLFFGLYLMTGAYWPSGMTAALFAWHPLHVESVAWVAERKDVLSAVFWMTTLMAYAWYVRRPSLLRYLLMTASFASGLMAKPMLVTLPAVLLLLDYWPLRRAGATRSVSPSSESKAQVVSHRWPLLLLEKVPLIVLALGACILTLLAQQSGGAISGLDALPLAIRLENAVIAYSVYLGKAIFPRNLAPLYLHAFTRYSAGEVATAALGIVLASAGCFLCRSRRPYCLVGWLWFLGTLVPVIGIVQIGVQAWADRYTYIPLIGLFIIVSWFLADIGGQPRLQPAVLGISVAIVGGYALGALQQMQYWHDSISLWRHAVVVSPRSTEAYNNLGQALAARHQPAEAIDALKRGLAIDPRHGKLLTSLGKIYAQNGRVMEAEECYRQATTYWDFYGPAHFNLAVLLFDRHQTEQAAQELRQTVALEPNNAAAHFALGRVLGKLKQYEAAVRELHLGYELDPDRSIHQAEQMDAAAIELHRQIELDPKNFRAHLLLGEICLEQRATKAALQHLEEAHRLKPDEPAPLALIKRAQALRP
jgi:tetratricopeptide (TPR) repeat protein